MRPSESPRGRAWLAQFELDDRATAVRLLDSIRFVSSGDVTAGVRQAFEKIISTRGQRVPITALPILSVEDMRSLDGGAVPSAPTVFFDFEPSQATDGEPGSEALMANMIREVRRGTEFSVNLSEFPVTIANLREERVRTLIFLTDYIGSGRQVIRYIDAWFRHPTIRSWRSYKRLGTCVVAFAATAGGLQSVQASPHIDAVKVVEMVPSLDVRSKLYADSKVKELCLLYARRGRLRGDALGYYESCGLFASSLAVPNNLPAILVRRSALWTPFFDGRSTPSELADQIDDFRPSVDVAQELMHAREMRLAARYAAGDIGERWREYIAMLALLPKTDEEIASRVGLALPRVVEIRQALVHLKLIDDAGQKTHAGVQVLLRAKRKTRIVTAGLQTNSSEYYPRLKR